MKHRFNDGFTLMRITVFFGLAGFVFASQIAAQQNPRDDESRGRLLYTTHCIACHNTQVHWRNKRVVTDWATLQAQVRLWQRQSGLAWSDADIVEVARHLNALHYNFETGGDTVALSQRR
jgi:mono/diheme cytochrome c family protein